METKDMQSEESVRNAELNAECKMQNAKSSAEVSAKTNPEAESVSDGADSTSIQDTSSCEESLDSSCTSSENGQESLFEMQNAECKMQNEELNAECEMQNAELSEEEEDYEKRAEEDMRELSRLFPELSPDGEAIGLGSLRNPTRFAELRDAGLSVEEAFLASNYRMLAERPLGIEDSRAEKAHLRTDLPRSRGRAATMPTSLLVRSRSLFEGLSDSELTSLYRRVTE